MKVGIGYENIENAFLAGRNVAASAVEKGHLKDPDIVFSYCHGNMDHFEFYRGLRSVVGESVPIIGGSATGIITNEDISYEGNPAGAAILSSPDIFCKWSYAEHLDHDETAAGRSLGEKFTPRPDDIVFLLFYDSIKASPTNTSPLIMNASPPLLQGIDEKLSSDVPIIGAGLLGAPDFRPVWQFSGDHVGNQEALGAMLSGDYAMYYCVMHGCTLMDGIYHTVTRVEGAKIYELDGLPIVSIINEKYGNRKWQEQRPLRRLALGVNHGEPYADFEEKNYVSRLITGILPKKDGIMLFEPDLKKGSRIQFMLRDSNEMIRSARQNTEKLLSGILDDHKKPVFGLYIDCTGRTATLSETIEEEAAEVVDVLNRHQTPLLGFYSGVEVAPMLGKSRGLDWTGILVVLAK